MESLDKNGLCRWERNACRISVCRSGCFQLEVDLMCKSFSHHSLLWPSFSILTESSFLFLFCPRPLIDAWLLLWCWSNTTANVLCSFGAWVAGLHVNCKHYSLHEVYMGFTQLTWGLRRKDALWRHKNRTAPKANIKPFGWVNTSGLRLLFCP